MNKKNAKGIVKNINHGSTPQGQFPSWQGSPVLIAQKYAPLRPMIIGENPIHAIVKNPMVILFAL